MNKIKKTERERERENAVNKMGVEGVFKLAKNSQK